MWVAILVGVGAGLLVAMVLIARQEKRYRVLFSDTHLAALAAALEASRTGSPTSTFEGVTVGWERMARHVAVTLESKQALAGPAARFLLAFVRDLVGEAEACQGLVLGKRRYAALWPRERVDGEHPVVAPEAEALGTTRQRAAAAMSGWPVVAGSLAAYR